MPDTGAGSDMWLGRGCWWRRPVGLGQEGHDGSRAQVVARSYACSGGWRQGRGTGRSGIKLTRLAMSNFTNAYQRREGDGREEAIADALFSGDGGGTIGRRPFSASRLGTEAHRSSTAVRNRRIPQI